MKPKLLFVLLFPLCILSCLFPNSLSAQSETHNFITYDTTVNLPNGGGMWNLRITRPSGMFGNGADTASRPAIIFMVGMGEITVPALIQTNGPHYWLNNGWDGGIQLSNGTHYPIIISVQPYTTGPTTRMSGTLLIHLLNTYHIKRNATHLTGLSMGAIRWAELINAEQSPGDETYMKKITSICNLEGRGNAYDDSVQGSSWILGNPPYRDITIASGWKAYGHWAKKYNGKYFGLEGISDGTQCCMQYQPQAMNDSVPGSAYYSYENIGGGGHCCWNSMYNPAATNWTSVGTLGPNNTTGSAPNTMGNYKRGDNLFRWMLRQGDTTLVGSAAVNQSPNANAGSNQTITLPVSSITLSGSGTDPDGTIASYAWSQVSGTAATIASPSSASTNITGLSTAGQRVFRLTVTDNSGAAGFSDVTITVNAAGGSNQSETNDFITEDSTVNFPGVGTWNYRISRPRNMFSPGHADTASRPAIIFMVGVGEACNCFDRLALNGPHALYNPGGGGWDGRIQLGNGTHYPIYISVQPHSAWPSTKSSRMLLEFLLNRYHIKRNSVHLTGLSMGAMTWTRMINSEVSPGDETSMKLVKSIAALQGQGNAYYMWRRDLTNNCSCYMLGGDSVVTPEHYYDMYTEPFGSPANPHSLAWKAYRIWAKKYGGRFFNLTGTTDYSGTDGFLISEAMNDTVPNAGYFAWENIGGGQHCCWNQMYDPNHTDWTSVGTLGPGIVASGWEPHSNTMGNYHTGDNIFTWMIKQGDTSLVGSAAANQSPVANPGPSQTILLPISQVTLTGSGTDPDGTIASYAWTQVSGTAATIASPNNATTNITGLTTSGDRIFRLTVTDNSGATGTGDVTITVSTAPSLPFVATNGTQTISTSIVSLTSASAGNGGIATTQWTKFSVPGQTVKTVTVIGSSTAAGNGTTSSDSAFVNRLKAYYISQGIITDIINLAVAGWTPDNQDITAALNYNSDVLLVSFPSNGYTASQNSYWLGRLQRFKDSTDARGKQFYITGTQPRNDYNPADKANLVVFNDSLRNRFGARFIDFLTPLINPADNNMKPEYYADGIHPNNAGHRVIYEKVKAANIFQNTISSASIITTPTAANTGITGLVNGTHKFQVSIVDNGGFAASAVATVTVNIGGNQPPIANAGAGLAINLPVSVVTLNGSGSDPDGFIASYSWTQVSGAPAIILTPLLPSTIITGLTTTGARVFRLTVTDNQGATATSDVSVTVTNSTPGPFGGARKLIPGKLEAEDYDNGGQNVAYYDGTNNNIGGAYRATESVDLRTCGDTGGGYNMGWITDGEWMKFSVTVTTTGTYTFTARVGTINTGKSIQFQVDGSTAGTLTVPNTGGWTTWQTGTLSNIALTAGDHTFRFLFNTGDVNNDANGFDINWFNFALVANQPPVANAGANQTITLPTSGVTLSGSGSDPDGTIASYAWTQVSGTPATIASPSSALTDITGLSTAGIRVFRLTVTDNQGATATSDVTVTVNAAAPPSNQPPVANAGANQIVILPASTATLIGSGSDPDGTIVSYAWTQVSGTAATIALPSASSTNISGMTTAGVRVFRLTVTDNLGATGTSDITITVNAAAPPSNQPPVANAGANQIVILPASTATLIGSGSDPDGTIVSYAWTQVSGTAATIALPSASSTNISGMTTAGVRVFRLTVTDDLGATGTSDITITVNAGAPPPNQPPVANAGANQIVILPASTATLIGSGSDPDGTIVSYAWTQVSGTAATIALPSASSTNISGMTTAGARVFRLTVTDNQGATATSDVTITVNAAAPPPNQPPVANAGINQTITLPTSSVNLSGSGSDPDGTIASYVWTQVSGTPATIASPLTAATNITGLTTAGIRVFRLTVTDNQGATGISDVTITVNAGAPPANQPPVANAGANQIITLPTSSASLSGSGSDPDGTIASYAWTQVNGTAATIASPSSASTNITGLTTAGIRVFRLTVTDNQGATGTSDVIVVVNAITSPLNQPPVANAGANQTIVLPTSGVNLSGSGSDPDGTIISYAWTQVSGTAATIASPSTAPTNITGLTTAGIRIFRLTVTDNQGATATSDVIITVNAAAPPPNQPPVANAGANQTIILPTSGVALSGSGSDPDGTIASYAWAQVSGTPATIISASTAATNITGLTTAGIRIFRLTVTDNQGATGTSYVIITVNTATAPPNQPPVANAGLNSNITLPTNSVTLTGSGTDPDGIIAAYQWSKIAGPAQFIIASPTLFQTAVNNLVEGVYKFELTVTDNQGAIGKDTVVITVNPAIGQPPTAHAGSDQTITLPTYSVTVTGSGTSDPNRQIASYLWTKIAGPASYTIEAPTHAQTVIKDLVQGVYLFELRVIDNQGSIGRDTVRIEVKEESVSTARLFPNPATTTINIEINAVTNTNITNISVFDSRGIVVYQEQFMRSQQLIVKQINIDRFPKGAYFISVGVDINNKQTLQFIKQ